MRPFTIAAAGCAAGWSLPAFAAIVPAVSSVLGIPRRLEDGRAEVALTFDDGPHPQGTPAVLDALARARAHATFFLVGEKVDPLPPLAAEIAATGHRVGIHGHRHRNLLRLPPRVFASDLDRAIATIGEATGSAPTLYRPPYGIFSAAGLVAVRRRPLTPLLWSRWGHDWRRRATPASIAREVCEPLVDGDVLLLHDADFYSAAGSWQATVAALPRVLDEIVRRGLRPVAA
jgi:peptidoglycan-N-acetylglucosamine deacetylase